MSASEIYCSSPDLFAIFNLRIKVIGNDLVN